MKRFVPAHQLQNAIDQMIAAQIAEFSELYPAAQVRISVCVTPGAGQRTFPGNFDGQHWYAAGQNSSPGGEQVPGRKTGTWNGGVLWHLDAPQTGDRLQETTFRNARLTHRALTY